MKTNFYLIVGIASILMMCCEKENKTQIVKKECSSDYSKHSKNVKYQAILDEYVKKGLTGIAVTVHTPGDIWTGASGYANVENSVKLTPCNPQYAASIQKSLMAVVTLQLIDEKKLEFGTKIGRFLSEEIKGCAPNYDKITVEHLLLHTSGLYDVFEEEFMNDFLTNPMATYTTKDFLAYIKEKGSVDEPGKKHYYSDANYILLSIVLDSVTGSHVKAIEDRILNPIHMVSSTYHNKNFPHPYGLVNSYWESPLDGSFQNVSDIQNQLTEEIIGADGLITTSTDLDIFINSLFERNLVSDKMKELIKTVKVKNENEQWLNDYYGYGFMFIPDEDHGAWIGHSGLHVGAAGFTYYNPQYNVSISAMTNSGTMFSEKYRAMFYYELFVDLIELTLDK